MQNKYNKQATETALKTNDKNGNPFLEILWKAQLYASP